MGSHFSIEECLGRPNAESREAEGFYAESKTVRIKRLTSYLRDIESYLKPDRNETRENVKTMEYILEFLLGQMAIVDELFKFLYRDIFYAGSYYDGLRITSASEFDLNIILAFPFKEAVRDVQEEDSYPGYAKYRLKKPVTELIQNLRISERTSTRFAELFDDDNYLLPERIRFWLQSVLDTAWYERDSEIKQLFQNTGLQKIEIKENGPARTLLILTLDGRKIDVDLVPVISFRYPEWPNVEEQHVETLNSRNGLWFLVPKPYFKGYLQFESWRRLWRLHFPLIERELLNHLGSVKPLIKILKKLRDEQNWKALASYYLKTFVMWEVLDSEDKRWSEDLGELFLELLHRLSERVEQRSLQYLFYPRYNLLGSMSQEEAYNISNRIKRIASSIERDPRNVLTFMYPPKPALL